MAWIFNLFGQPLPSPGQNGYVLTSESGAWVPQAIPANTAPAGYQTALSLDLTAQGTVNVSANGSVTIGGLTWTRINAANDFVAMTLASGGLTVEAAQGTHFANGTTVTACGLYIPLTSLISTIAPSTPVRVTMYSSAISAGSSGPQAVVGLYNGSNECFVYTGRYCTGSNASEPGHGWQIGSSTGAGTVLDTGQTTANVFQIEFPQGIGSMQAYCRCGVWSSGYPAASAMVTSFQTEPGQYTETAVFSAYLGSMSQWNLFIGGTNALSNGNGSVTIANLLVESKL